VTYNLDEDIEFFFQLPSTPTTSHARGHTFSVLYLLRRELMETAGHDPDVTSEAIAVDRGVERRLFASVTLMFTGFDLLSKFACDHQTLGERFCAFLESEFGRGLDADTAKMLYAVRNSMVHAFGVPDRTSLGKLGMSSIALAHRETMNPPHGRVITLSNGNVGVVYVNGLYSAFIQAERNLYDSMFDEDAEENRQRFKNAFDTFGTIGMP
jgi:hypothetical protein